MGGTYLGMPHFALSPESCPHDHVGKEYLAGMDTGDKLCNDCGEKFSPAEWREMRDRRDDQ